MLLVSKIPIEHFLAYKEDYVECLKFNINNNNISKIIIFVELIHPELPKSSKVEYLVRRGITEQTMFDTALKLSTENRIIMTKEISIFFNDNLSKISSEKTVYKNEYYTILNRETKFNNDFKKSTDLPIVYKINSLSDKIITQIEQVVVRKKGEVVKSKLRGVSSKLDVIIISVNYNDFLLVSLTHNTKIFDNITVVTSSDDLMCQKICERFDIKCIVTDCMYDNGSTFNKGKAINVGIDSITDPGFVLLLDADIVVSEEIKTSELDVETLYTSDRLICNTYEDYNSLMTDCDNWKRYSQFEADKGLGFFHLFHYSKQNTFPETSDNASFSDLLFRDKFTKRSKINNKIIHLGRAYKNWNGRVTDRLLNDNIFLELFTNIENSKNNKVLKKSLRDPNINSKLAVLTTYFNPMNYTNIKYNYKKFSENLNCDLFTIELSFDENFYLEGEKVFHIRGNKNNILWQKERLLNILLEKIPSDYTNIAWVDCDILFENNNWVEETNNMLKKYKVVQLYELANRLNENYDVETQSVGLIKRIDEINQIDLNLSKGIPGFAWAIRREVIEEIKFLDTQIIGGGDSLMCYSFLGHKRGFVSDKMNPEWFRHFSDWSDKAMKIVDKSVNYVNGEITHLYHGKMTNRRYNERYLILSENKFDPEIDLRKDENDLWEFNNDDLSDKLQNYFDNRNEDDNVLDMNEYFDKIFVLNLDRREDRWSNVSKKLNDIELKYERFSAVDGNDIEFKPTNFRNGMGMLENKYALACLMSHLEIIKLAKNKGYKRILILEDDVLISKDFKVRFQHLRYIKSWKLLYLGCSQYDWNIEMRNNHFYLSKKSLGTFSYAMDHSIYDEIIELLETKSKSVDNLLSDIQSKYYGECFTFYPNICKADVSESEIRGQRNNEEHSIKMKWNLIDYI